MTAFVPDKQDVENETAILQDQLYHEERPVIRDLLQLLQGARSADDYMQLQLKLIARAKARQQIAEELRATQERLNDELRELVGQGSKPIDEIKELQRQLELCKHQRRVSEALRWIVISIGDAIAWKALGYDRAAITILGQGERVARFADKAGFDAEVTAIDQQWREGRLAIHNDLTTCLRHGDVTIIDPATRSVHVGEVKLSKELGPDDPQMQRLEDATTLINEGRLERPNRPALNVHRIDLPYRTHIAQLRDLLSKARREAYAAAKVGPCLFVEVLRFDAGLSEDQILARRSKPRTKTGWFDGGTNTFQWIWTVRRMRDRRYSFSALPPFPLLPLDLEDLTDLVMGWVDVIVTLNADCLAEAFRAKGLDVDIALPPEHADVFLRARKRFNDWEVTVEISPQLREQMLNELMTTANVVGAAERLINILSALARDEGQGEQHVVALANEQRVWEAR